jgi:TRAP-type uncharacterized transport system substrate-binding protein
MRFKSGIIKTCVFCGIVAIFLLGVEGNGHAAKARLRVMYGSTGGAYYVIMAGMATLIEKYAKDTNANVQVGTTVTENLKLVRKKDVSKWASIKRIGEK